jgi:phenylacetic acid degradation operon negative regulatory protein
MSGLLEGVGELSILAVRAAWSRWFSHERFLRKLAQFESRGWIEMIPAGKDDLNGAVRLTEAGREAALGGRDPERSWSREWDGNWRIVLFDIPETQHAVRKRLGRGLRRLGFGYLQHSVWVSPDPVVEVAHLLRGLKLNVEVLSVMDARPCAGGSDLELVAGAWDFERINRNYDLYLEVLDSRPLRTSGRSWRTWLDVECKAWNRAVGDDPLLPGVLHPRGYRGREALRRRLAGAQKLFAGRA